MHIYMYMQVPGICMETLCILKHISAIIHEDEQIHYLHVP